MSVAVRILLRSAKCFIIYNINLNVIPVLGKVCSEYRFNNINPFFTGNNRGIKTLVQQKPTLRNQFITCRQGVYNCSRSVYVDVYKRQFKNDTSSTTPSFTFASTFTTPAGVSRHIDVRGSFTSTSPASVSYTHLTLLLQHFSFFNTAD